MMAAPVLPWDPSVTLYIADLRDSTLSTKQVNLNGSNAGLPDLLLMHDFNLGQIETEPEWLIQSPRPGAIQTSRRHPVVEMSFRLFLAATSYTDIRGAVNLLNQGLDQHGIMVLKETASSPRLLIDFYPSPLSGVFRGQKYAPGKIIQRLTDPDGLPVRVWRHPYMRAASLAGVANYALNGLLLDEDATNANRPDEWDWDTTANIASEEIDWSVPFLGPSYTFVTTTSSNRNLQQIISPAAAGEVWSFGYDAAGGTGSAARAVIEFLSAANAVLATSTGTLTAAQSSGGWHRITVTSSAAPTNTAKVRVSMRLTPPSASADQWWLRNAMAEKAVSPSDFRAGPSTVSNDLALATRKHIWLYNPGNATALCQVHSTPDASSSAVRMMHARRSGDRNSAQFINDYFGFTVKTATLSNGTTGATADADASGAVCASTDFASGGTERKKRWRKEWTPSDGTTMQGSFRVFMALSGAVGAEFNPQFRYGPGDVDDLPYVLEPVKTLDLTDAVVRQFEIVDFGIMQMEKGTTGVFMEGWSGRLAGSGTLRWDEVWFVPADEQVAMIVIPGNEDPVLAKTDKWLANILVVPTGGSLPTFAAGELLNGGKDMVLRPSAGNLQACATPNLTLSAAVQHKVTVTMYLYNPLMTKLKHGELRVYDLTADTQVAKGSINGIVGLRWPTVTPEAVFTATAGHVYLYYVVYTASGSGNMHVQVINDTYTPPILGSSSQAIAMDGDVRLLYALDAGAYSRPLVFAEGTFIELEPGPNLLISSLGDNPGEGHANPKHVASRTMAVTGNVYPRYK